jgi:hypothetical protein
VVVKPFLFTLLPAAFRTGFGDCLLDYSLHLLFRQILPVTLRFTLETFESAASQVLLKRFDRQIVNGFAVGLSCGLHRLPEIVGDANGESHAL